MNKHLLPMMSRIDEMAVEMPMYLRHRFVRAGKHNFLLFFFLSERENLSDLNNEKRTFCENQPKLQSSVASSFIQTDSKQKWISSGLMCNHNRPLPVCSCDCNPLQTSHTHTSKSHVFLLVRLLVCFLRLTCIYTFGYSYYLWLMKFSADIPPGPRSSTGITRCAER